MKLQILVPTYKETLEEITPLLDSIAIQQSVNFDDIGVIICNDGENKDYNFPSYPYKIEYYKEPHRGVSGTRNACLDKSTADYVMFCDADDMFINACGLYIIFREIEQNNGFDTLISVFVEETRNPDTGEVFYINREMDSTFVHGKVHRRKFLINNNIRWNEKLTIHEDSYFNCLCQKLGKEVKYCQNPFYLWKWRDNSVCRHDPKYILKTFNNMLESNTALVKEFQERMMPSEAQFYATMMIYDSYFTLNKDEWINQENQEYRKAVEIRFKQYWNDFKKLYEEIPQDIKTQIIMNIKNRMYLEGLVMEHITFDDWIKTIEEKY